MNKKPKTKTRAQKNTDKENKQPGNQQENLQKPTKQSVTSRLALY